MKRLFANTRGLISFIVKKERLSLFIWTISIIGFSIGFVPFFEEMMETTGDMTFIEETMKSPAMVAMIGPFYAVDGYSVGSMYSSYMFLYLAIILGVMNIFFILRHTRADEEEGRMELLLAQPIGRLSPIWSLSLVALAYNLIIGLGSSLCLKVLSSSLDMGSCLVFGAMLFVFGLFSASLSLFLAQIFTSKRGLLSSSFVLLLIMYALRAIGDVYWEELSLVSPLGLIIRSQNFVEDYLWPIGFVLLEGLTLFLLALGLAYRRDLGEGLISERKGRKHGSFLLRGVYSFTWSLSRSSFLIWSLVILSFAAMYGSVFGDLDSYISSSELLGQIIGGDQGGDITDQYISMLMAVMASISTIPVLIQVHRVLGQEKRGFAELVLSHSVSRRDYLGSHFVLSLALAVALPLLTGLGFWGVGQYFLEDIYPLKTFLLAASQYIPAILVFLSISTLLIGMAPRLAWVNYLYLALCFGEVYLGQFLNLSEKLRRLSLFHHIGSYPLEDFNLEGSMVLFFLFLFLSYGGFRLYGRRDLN